MIRQKSNELTINNVTDLGSETDFSVLYDNEYITISKAAKLSPSRPHVSAVWRWCRKGLKTRSGDYIRLKHVRVGGKIYTTKEALQQFFVSLARADTEYFNGHQTFSRKRKKRIRNGNSRQCAIASAESELEAAGI